MHAARFHLHRISHRVTRFVAHRWGDVFPFYYVCEYPKSGGTWLGKMVADVLGVPYPPRSTFPLGMSCVIHNHWNYDARLKRAIYLYRDGRDVMVSYFFYRMRLLQQPRIGRSDGQRAAMERIFGKEFDPTDSIGLLPRFIENELRNPRDASLSWPNHIRNWHASRGKSHVAYVSYEELRSDCAAALTRVAEHVSDRQLEPWRIAMAVEKFSFARQTGRKPGVEDRGSFIRKGMTGDWVNHFSREAAEVFDRYAGDVLVELEYEPDRAWIDRYVLAGQSAESVP